MPYLLKYNVADHLYLPIIKRAVVDFAVGADWTPAAGDVKVSKDGGAAANIGTLPAAIAMGNAAMWDFTLTGTELSAKKIKVIVSDSATKAVEDQFFDIFTYGHASAQYTGIDLNDAVRLGLTSLPNAAAEAAGGLFTRGAGAGQINQAANGMIDTNPVRLNNVAASLLNLEKSASVIKRGSATGATTTTTLIDSTLTESGTDHWKGRIIIFTSGALLYQASDITAFDPATDKITFTAMTAAASGGDTYVIV